MILHYVHKPATALEVRAWCARIRNYPELHLIWDQRFKKFREKRSRLNES